MLRVHRIPHSTNVERVALAAALKGLEVAWVDHDAGDRSGLIAVSGQPLAPVAELPDGRVVSDSPAILRELDALAPEPPLWPREPGDRARADIFVEWFNEVWKGPPNRIADGAGSPADAARLRTWCARFEDLLADGRPFLLGADLTVADIVAAPFAPMSARRSRPETSTGSTACWPPCRAGSGRPRGSRACAPPPAGARTSRRRQFLIKLTKRHVGQQRQDDQNHRNEDRNGTRRCLKQSENGKD